MAGSCPRAKSEDQEGTELASEDRGGNNSPDWENSGYRGLLKKGRITADKIQRLGCKVQKSERDKKGKG